MSGDKLFIVNLQTDLSEEEIQQRLTVVMMTLQRMMETEELIKVYQLHGQAENIVRAHIMPEGGAADDQSQ